MHACIDGYSRLITFCKCATNNKSNTVLQLFLKAEENFGLPLRVRTDYDVENVSVREYMNKSISSKTEKPASDKIW